MKELKFSPNTQLYDIKHKISKVPDWLLEGEKVRLSVKFAGREIAHPETGIQMLQSIIALIPDAQVDRSPTLDGKQMWCLISRKSAKQKALDAKQNQKSI